MKNIILFSGGNDSAKLLEIVKEPILLFIDYGQKSARLERKAVEEIAAKYGYAWEELNLTSVFANSDNPLITGSHAETIEETVVPFRNGLFISAAASWAIDKYKDRVAIYIGVHKSTIEDMNDCSSTFIDRMNMALYMGTGGKAVLMAPFVNCLKKDILTKSAIRKLTYTCYEGVPGGCGKCIACKTMQKYM